MSRLNLGLQYFAESEDPEKEKPKNVEGEPSGGDPTFTPDDNLPKSQEELDRLIEKRLSRERKKWTRQPQHEETPPAELSKPEPQINQELLLVKAQLAAVRSGVLPEMAEDAVYLALRDAQKEGDPDDESIKEALSGVLKRHPEWKQDAKNGQIRFGADGTQEPPSKKTPLPNGRMIF